MSSPRHPFPPVDGARIVFDGASGYVPCSEREIYLSRGEPRYLEWSQLEPWLQELARNSIEGQLFVQMERED